MENSQGEHLGLTAEHGLSFFIENDKSKVIFDMGQGPNFLTNARKMGIDPATAEVVALSHGHYDHTGGFRSLVDAGFRGKVVTGKGFFDSKYGTDGISMEFLGNDFQESYLGENGLEHMVVDVEKREIAPGVFALSCFRRTTPSEIPNPRFLVERGGKFEIDDFGDEICLAVAIKGGYALILGCSHPGIENILRSAKANLDEPIKVVIGGTHLVEASEEKVESFIAYVRESGIETIGVSHCTGRKAVGAIFDSGLKCFRNTTGHSLFLK